jgi:hypothetical protein
VLGVKVAAGLTLQFIGIRARASDAAGLGGRAAAAVCLAGVEHHRPFG